MRKSTSRQATDVAKQRAKILQKLAEGFSCKRAATAAGLHRTTLIKWRHEDSDFDEACAEAIEQGTDEVEDIALNQARKGNGIVTMFLLNARRPDKYKRNAQGNEAPQVSFTLNIGNSVQPALDVSKTIRGDLLPEGQIRE